MISVNIDGKQQIAFLVKRGEENNVVIPHEGLRPVDYKRLKAIEERAGDMMENMRDTRLENGVNALECYQHLLKVVPRVVVANGADPVAEEAGEASTAASGTEQTEPVKRGRTKRSTKSA